MFSTTGVTHHLCRLERFSVKACEAEAVFWEPVTVLQLLSITRGLVFVRVRILDFKKEEQENKTEAMVTLILL